MRKFAFNFKVITPMFIYGADKQHPEIRPSSIRGALRFWFRAMMGGVTNGNVHQTKKYETEIFGGQFSTFSTHSKVRVWISNISDEKSEIEELYNYLNNKKFHPVTYLTYLFALLKSGKTSYIKENAAFDVIVEIKDERIIDCVIGTLWLFFNFGGLGARSRRGFGAIKPISPELKFNGIKFIEEFQNVKNYVYYLKDGISNVTRIFKNFITKHSSANNKNPIPDFDIIKKDACIIEIIDKLYDSWESALNEVGEIYSNFIKKRSIGERRIFGLPRGYMQKRRASPLFIRPVFLKNGYSIMLITFKSKFLENEVKPRDGYAILDEFRKSVCSKGLSLLPVEL